MLKSPTISQKKPDRADLDFLRLRQEAMDCLEGLAGETWTDYNTHDPGITLLEALIYGLTDLGYRMEWPMEDLLTPNPEDDPGRNHQFLTPAQALSCEPITETDYRKLIIDCHEDILNAWLIRNEEKKFQSFTVNGLYDILLQLNPSLTANKEEITKRVKNVFSAHRNLCEDVVNIHTIAEEEFSICADIQVEANADVETVHARILWEVQQFLTPSVRRYTLQELMDKGYSADEIFEGMVPQFGFFDEEELEKSGAPLEGMTIHVSDLVGVIMKVPGVLTIPKIHLKTASSHNDRGEAWTLPIAAGKLPLLSDWAAIRKPGNEVKNWSPIRFYKDLFRYHSKIDDLAAIMGLLWQTEQLKMKNQANAAKDLPVPSGKWREVGRFSTIQKELPAVYGVGATGVPVTGNPTVDSERKAKAQQLQAYLLFFEQIMASHAGMLQFLPALLSFQRGNQERLRRVFTARLPENVNHFSELFSLFNGLSEEKAAEAGPKLQELLDGLTFRRGVDNDTAHRKQRSLLLDHLLARFGENFNDYVLRMHPVFGGKRQEWEIIDDKEDFLNEYEILSKHRARAFNYRGMSEDDSPLKLWYNEEDYRLAGAETNVAGVVRRVARLTGIDNYRTRRFAKINYETYQETDANGAVSFRFRVVEPGTEKILISGITGYPTEEAAVLGLKTAINRAMFPDGYERKETANEEKKRYYFNVIEAEGQVLARRIEYFESPEKREAAIQFLMDFLMQRYSDEGFYLIEHLLLFPLHPNDRSLKACIDEECEGCESADPYSFRVSVVLPGYTPRFTNLVFRDYFERTLRAELPAHILAKICWIGKPQMTVFEEKYQAWLEYRARISQTGVPEEADTTQNELIEILEQLYSLYPPGILQDCDEDPGTKKRPIVLSRSHLGTQKEEDLNPE
ncbi:MAG: hypothetical protein U0X91_09385 [Spirosomataceae bacterium]